jgi:hypothetical protein
VNKREAREIQAARIEELRRLSYQELVERLVDTGPLIEEIVGPSGTTYQLEIQGLWEDKRSSTLRVLVSIDDGGWRSFMPLGGADFIMRPDGRS